MGILKETLIKKDEIHNYIPQREPIIMVDEFLGIDGASSFTKLTVTTDNFFIEENGLNECGIIEHVAQSAALRMGYLFKQEGKKVPLGFIGALNKCSLIKQAKVNDTLYTKITLEHELLNISLISATVEVCGEIIATCQMKIFLEL